MYSVPAPTFAHLIALFSLLLPAASLVGDTPAGDESPGGSPAQPHISAIPADSVTAPANASKEAEVSIPSSGGGGSPVIKRGETPSAARRERLVYACRDAATPVFSDRPCGASAHAWRLDLPPTPASGAAPSTRAAAPAAATRPIAARSPPRDTVARPDTCARLEAQLAAIDARMRNGYTAREAARLWQRWRDAKAKLRAARC